MRSARFVHRPALRTAALLSGIAMTLCVQADVGSSASPDSSRPGGGGVLSQRSLNIVIPPINMQRDDGQPVQLDRELDDGRPVFVNFIFTTCFGICPISSQTFAQIQSRLGDEANKVHLVSITLDPEEDTASVLHSYAKKYHAGPSWNHYTGTVEASIAAQKAFGVYLGDKMNHEPVTEIRIAPGRPWIRIDGFATASDLIRIFHQLQGAS